MTTAQIEKALIGALMQQGTYTLIVDFFKENYLESPLSRKVYREIQECIKESVPIETSILASRVARGDIEREMVALTFITECQFACPSSSNIKHYATQIMETALRSRIQKITQETIMNLANKDMGTREIQGLLAKEIQNITEQQTPTKSIPVPAAISQYIDEYYAVIDEEKNGKKRMFYGIEEIDEVTGGITSGEFIVIAARTNVGKSILALNLHYNMGYQGKKILYCSIEMNRQQITSRLLSRITGIPHTRFTKFQLTPDEHDKVSEAYEEYLKQDMHFLTTGELTLDQLRLELIKNQDHQYDAIIIDYVQIMSHGDIRMGMTERVTQLSHGLKQLAQEFGTAIIGVAQLNRDAVKDGEPEIHHLQNSAALEQDAEVIILLHRDKEDPESVEGKRLLLLIRKNRKGKNNINIMLHTDLSRMYIANKEAF